MTQDEIIAGKILKILETKKLEFLEAAGKLLGASKIAALKYVDHELQRTVDECDKAFRVFTECNNFANIFIQEKEKSEVKNDQANSTDADGRGDLRNAANSRVQDELQDEPGSR